MYKKTLIGLCFIFLFSTSSVYSSQNNALEIYAKAEIAFKKHQLEAATLLYKQALKEYSLDGELITETSKSKKIISLGRTVKQIEYSSSKKMPYFPNYRLKEIQDLIDNQYRSLNPPVLEIRWLSLEDPIKNNIIDGGESGDILIEIKNIGKSDAQNINLDIKMDNTKGLQLNDNTSSIELKAGESTLTLINFLAVKNIPEMIQKIRIQANQSYGSMSNELEINIPSKPHLPANIVFVNTRIDDFSDNGLIEPNEIVFVNSAIRNIGEGISDVLIARLSVGENMYLNPDSVKSIEVGKLYPGEEKEINFSFLPTNKFIHNQSLPVALTITNQTGEEIVISDLGLKINSSSERTLAKKDSSDNKAGVLQAPNLIDVDMLIPKGIKNKKNAFAVVIGNRNYQKSGLPRVEYALNDARVMKDYLIETMGFDEHNIFYYEDATTAIFSELFGTEENHEGRISNHVIPNKSELFIYYSGHGAPDIKSNNSFFVPVDADPNYIGLSGYSLDLFYNNLAKISAKQVVVVLDTCFSGNSDGGYLLRDISPAIINFKVNDPRLKNAVIFTSTRQNQVSVWFHEKRHSLFTYYFMKGLNGAADNNNDLQITSTEMGGFLKDSVPYQARRINGIEQNPMLIQYQDVKLATLIASKSLNNN